MYSSQWTPNIIKYCEVCMTKCDWDNDTKYHVYKCYIVNKSHQAAISCDVI